VGGWLSFLGILGTACLLLSGDHHLLNDNAKSVECIILNGVRAGKKALFHRNLRRGNRVDFGEISVDEVFYVHLCSRKKVFLT
jgi:hypothetical protein